MKIYFTAHATTTDNEAGRSSGWNDAALSKLGKQQARALTDHLKNLRITAVYCSDLKRSYETAKIAFGNTLPIIADQRLREINYGDYNGKPKAEVDAIKLTHLSQPFPNGESYSQAVARVQAFYRELKAQHPDATSLIVGHRATQFGLDTLVQGKTLEACVTEKFVWQPYWEYTF